MEADRNRHKALSDLDWQATDKLSIHGNGEYTDDDYLNSAYGLKKDVFWAASMDASYAASENLVADVFLYLRQPAAPYQGRRLRQQQHYGVCRSGC